VFVFDDARFEAGCVVDCANDEFPVFPAEPVELDWPSDEYHPLFCRNGYQPLSSEASARKGMDNNISNTAIFRIGSPLRGAEISGFLTLKFLLF